MAPGLVNTSQATASGYLMSVSGYAWCPGLLCGDAPASENWGHIRGMKSRLETRLETNFLPYGLVGRKFHVAEVLGRYSNDKSVAARLERVAKALVEAQAGRTDTNPVPRQDWHPHALDSRLSATQKASLVGRYRDGEGSSTLARAFGLSENGVLALLRRLGVALRPPSKVTAADRTGMQRLRQAGWTYAAIGERFGVTRVTVSRQLGTAGGGS